MVRTREVIPAPLEHALLATRVLAVLYAPEKAHNTPILESTLDDAAKFLRNIIEGRKYTKERLISHKSFEYALAYGEAIRAIEMLPKQEKLRGEVSELLSGLLQTTESFKAGKEVAPERRELLKMFFTHLRKIAANADAKPIEIVSISN